MVGPNEANLGRNRSTNYSTRLSLRSEQDWQIDFRFNSSRQMLYASLLDCCTNINSFTKKKREYIIRMKRYCFRARASIPSSPRKFIIETRRTGIIVIDFQSRASEIRTSTREINNSFSIKKKKKIEKPWYSNIFQFLIIQCLKGVIISSFHSRKTVDQRGSMLTGLRFSYAY